MLTPLKKLFSFLNPARNSSFVGKQLKNPTGLFASKVARGMNESNKKLYDLTFQNLEVIDHDKILEIGFGNGYFFDQLNQKNQNAKLSGVEISKEMISPCTKLNEHIIAEIKLEIKHFDGLNLPYENEFFDNAIAINVIYSWENPSENIKELNRVLKLDGALKIGIRPFNVLSHLPFAKEHFNIQKDDWWIDSFQKEGFLLINNQSTTEMPIQFNGKTYNMNGTCLTFKKSKTIKN
jgi:SAM-dependent methyltransferase